MSNWFPNFFKPFIHSCLDLLFLRRCFGCGREKTWLCDRCLDNLPRSWSPREDKIFSVFEYGSPVMKQVIWRLKYKSSLELAETLAKPMYDVLLEELQDELMITFGAESNFKCARSRTSHKVILIPVPLSPARLRSRGYNQAEELAKQIAKLNPQLFEVRADIIKKIKDTPTQVSTRNREARLKNLKGAFSISSPPNLEETQGLAGATNSQQDSTLWSSIFAIIDDVSTTGTTISEIRSLLTNAGCHHVYGLVAAHG